MFPFSLRPKTPSEEPPVYEPPEHEGIARFREFRDIGETFNYLGRECVVTSHKTMFAYGFGGGYTPELKADYCDENGVVRTLVFRITELPTLIKQNGGK